MSAVETLADSCRVAPIPAGATTGTAVTDDGSLSFAILRRPDGAA